MPNEKIKENPTKKLQALVKKRETKLILTKQNQFGQGVRRIKSSSFTAEVYSSFYDE